jgi:carbon starvation protein CstA
MGCNAGGYAIIAAMQAPVWWLLTREDSISMLTVWQKKNSSYSPES